MMKFKKRGNTEDTNANNLSNNDEPSKSLDPPPNLNLQPEQKQEKLKTKITKTRFKKHMSQISKFNNENECPNNPI